MRALLACCLLALAACRTASLGQCNSDSDCPSGASCDPSAKVCAVPAGGCFPACASGFSCRNAGCVDDQPPAITGITVLTPPDVPGTAIYRGDDAGTLAVAARITDPSGVANVCLGVAGESGCPHPGASADGGYWTFTVPRAPSVGTNDGTAVAITISADDQPDGSVPNHGSAAGSILFDNAPPTVQIAADTVAYARLLVDGGSDLVPVQATIVDGSGVCDAGPCAPQLDAGSPNFFSYSSQNGGVFTFNLPATLAASGAEGNLGFTVTAQDQLGHKGSAAGTRFIDDVAPGVSLKVWRDGDPEPGSPGVTAPTAVANTGHNGTRFIYSDVVRVKGSINDDGGLSAASWRIDGLELNGGIATGVPHPICAAGQTSCAVEFTVALNAAGNGSFHTRSAEDPGPGGTNIPAGTLNLIVTAGDSARNGSGELNANSASPASALPTTRFLWLQSVTTTVAGLALHPNGDLIVTTTSSNNNSVYAVDPAGVLAQDGGIPWRYGLDISGTTDFGAVLDMPAIGAGTAGTAPIYAASIAGNVVALAPDGGVLWLKTGLQAIATAPAVAQVVANGAPVEEVIVPSDNAGASLLYGVFAADGGVTSVSTDDIDAFSAPLILNSRVYFGTGTSVTRWDLVDGGFANEAHGVTGGPFWSLTTDGGVLYAATKTAADALLTSFTESTIASGTTVFLDGGVNDDFIVDMTGHVVAADRNDNVVQIDPADGGITILGTSAGNTSLTPLQGANGALYVPRNTGFFYVLVNGQLSWTFDPPSTIFHAATIDCQGRVYLGSGSVVYSLVADDPGLADAPWPNFRRDTRATGNFSAPKHGMRTVSGCAQ